MAPIEVRSDPLIKVGYVASCDVSLPEVQKQLLYAGRDGGANVWS